MKVPERFCITIRGTRQQVRNREYAVPKIGHYLQQLLMFPGDIPDGFFDSWGLDVKIEEDKPRNRIK